MYLCRRIQYFKVNFTNKEQKTPSKRSHAFCSDMLVPKETQCF